MADSNRFHGRCHMSENRELSDAIEPGLGLISLHQPRQLSV